MRKALPDVRVIRAQGSTVGHTFEQLRFMIDLVDDKSRIGVCLDTCHLFAAGVPIPVLSKVYGYCSELCVHTTRNNGQPEICHFSIDSAALSKPTGFVRAHKPFLSGVSASCPPKGCCQQALGDWHCRSKH